MEIKITENQINALKTCIIQSFISKQFDRFECMTDLIDKIPIFSDEEWESINDHAGLKPYTEFPQKIKFKHYLEKHFQDEKCYFLTFEDQLHMILSLNFYQNKSGCIPFFDIFSDGEDAYYLLIYKQDYLEK